MAVQPIDLAQALVDLKRDDVLTGVQHRLDAGDDPVVILQALRDGMTEVGYRFEAEEFYLAELMLSAEVFKDSMAILGPELAKGAPPKPLGTMVLATLRGDIHDLGKNILAELLRGHGFEVIDLGVDVPVDVFVNKVEEVRPDFVAMSALMASAFPHMLSACQELEKAGLRKDFKLLIGGGCTTSLVKEKCGADLQTLDAMDGVKYCMGQSGRD